ncbi:hypothetical protein NG819_15700 [Pseudarthrobacter sp. Fe7]|nr:hypothetical protein NG819_15700 [Pseudarthrobacter sp. Fe7]
MNPTPVAATTAQVPDEPLAPARGGLLAGAIGILAAFAGLGAATLSFGTSATLLTTATTNPGAMAGAVSAGLWGAALTVWAVQSLRS